MNLSIGIVGLPNAGKSTLFNALVKNYQAKVAPHPFATIDPNIGIVEVPDQRLKIIQEKLQLQKKVPATIKFIDIAGLIKGSHQGEGLGNQFLSQIRNCQAILILLGCFNKDANPQEDLATLQTELILKDIETISKLLEEKHKLSFSKKAVLEKILHTLNHNQWANLTPLSAREKEEVKDLSLLTLKPILYVNNISEQQSRENWQNFPKEALVICAKLESQIWELDEKEQKEYRAYCKIKEDGSQAIIQKAYQLLNLISFYTLLPNQIQAWPIQKNTKAIDAAAIIHSDFAQKFINALVISYAQLLHYSSWQEALAKGKIRVEGKRYLIQDGDVIYFKHG